jgi:hypothetical protein
MTFYLCLKKKYWSEAKYTRREGLRYVELIQGGGSPDIKSKFVSEGLLNPISENYSLNKS